MIAVLAVSDLDLVYIRLQLVKIALDLHNTLVEYPYAVAYTFHLAQIVRRNEDRHA